MVAAVLDLDIGARAGAEAVDEMPAVSRTDMMSLTGDALAAIERQAGREGLGLRLFAVADDVIDFGHVGEALRFRSVRRSP